MPGPRLSDPPPLPLFVTTGACMFSISSWRRSRASGLALRWPNSAVETSLKPFSNARPSRGFLLLGRRVTQRARLFVRELLDFASDLRAERAAATLERLELARMARDLPFELRRARGQIPRRRERLLDFRRRVPRRIRAR